MPKAAVAQTGFTTGEVSPLCYGVFDNPRYKKGLEIGLNYIPTLQGPLTRRPGTKYLTNVKDSANPPVFIPFQFSASQNYILEFGDQYIRFFANNGQLITVGTSYQLFGTLGNSANIQLPLSIFHATRTNTLPLPNEILTAPPSPITAGSILELQSPYAVGAVPNIRWAQNGDTLYLFHAQYRPFKLQRQSQTEWTIKPVFFTDGPYLPANSFALAGDNADVTLNSQDTNQITSVVVGNLASVTGAIADPGGSGQIQITTSAGNGVATGAKIFIQGVVGTTEANNYSSAAGRTSTNAAYWVVKVTSPTTFLLLGSVFTHAYVSGGAVAPALFATSAAQALLSPFIQDVGRSIALVIGGKRYWGYINTVYDAATIDVYTGGTTAFNPTAFPGGNAQA